MKCLLCARHLDSVVNRTVSLPSCDHIPSESQTLRDTFTELITSWEIFSVLQGQSTGSWKGWRRGCVLLWGVMEALGVSLRKRADRRISAWRDGAGQAAQSWHMVAQLLVEFHLLILEVAFQEVPEMDVFLGRIPGTQIQRGLVQVLLQDSTPPGFNPPVLGAFCTWGKRAKAPTVLHQEDNIFASEKVKIRYIIVVVALLLLLILLREEEPHGPVGNRSPETGRCRRRADASLRGGWWQPPPWWDNSDEFGGSWLMGNKEQSSKNGVAWFWKAGVGWDGGSGALDSKRDWSMVGGWERGHPRVCFSQTLVKREVDGGLGPLPICSFDSTVPWMYFPYHTIFLITLSFFQLSILWDCSI